MSIFFRALLTTFLLTFVNGNPCFFADLLTIPLSFVPVLYIFSPYSAIPSPHIILTVYPLFINSLLHYFTKEIHPLVVLPY